MVKEVAFALETPGKLGRCTHCADATENIISAVNKIMENFLILVRLIGVRQKYPAYCIAGEFLHQRGVLRDETAIF